ncbi:MAG: N-6 DNA methylase [Candidatus Pacebacteria bacterium]|nr:N-6 DNA methylase [Candidatus Paceibacterota bacterium]
MSEELLQRDLVKNPEKIGKWDFYNIGATTLKALKRHKKIRDIDYGILERKKPDALIIQQKQVIAVIEYKTPKEFKTEAQKKKAIKQEIEVAQKLGAKIFIATDTKETIWVNSLTENRIGDENGKEIKTLFDPKNERIAELIKKIYDSINEQSDNIKPRQFVNPTNLAKSIWQDIWSVSGATPENCLYTFVELFIFKYLSDLGVLKGTHNFYTLMKMYEENTENEVLEHYADTIRKKIKTLFPESTLDKTTIINGTIFVSKDQKAVKGYSTTFRTVLDKFNKYGKLEHIDYDFKSQLFESFLKESISKKNWGQFFTPLKVIRPIIEMAKDDIKDGVKICDPACGVGKFLLEPLVTKLDEFYKISKKGIAPKITIHGFDKGFDKDEQKTIILAKANMLIYFSDLIKDNPEQTQDFAKLFNDSFILKTNSILGTLSDPVEDEYDLILTNPPYVTSGSGNLKDEIKKDGDLINYYKINAMGVEGLFMEWIVKALKPGGKAFIVIPDGILNRQNDKNLRKFILDECYIDGLISLPLNTFFTTNKKTYILAITKKINKKDIQKDPIFTYLVSEIGESRNIYRFDIDQNDLREAVTLYSFFKGNKKGFEKINSDKRCKLQPFSKFLDNIEKTWIVDKWWTEKEKIELGIIEKKDKVTLLEFASIIEDIGNSIKEFQDEVKEISEKKKTEIDYKSFSVSELFDTERGLSKYTKKYGDIHKGKFPVFSASNNAPLTHIDTFDFDGEYLTWATNGFAGYIKITSGKFSINADRGLLKPKQENLNLKYVKYKLEPILRNLAKGRKGENGEDEFTKVYPSILTNIKIDFQVNANNEIDTLAQNEVVEKIIFIEETKQKVLVYKKKINELNVEIGDISKKNKLVEIKDIFNIEKGKSKYTNKYIQSYSGEYPLYSSQTVNDGTIGKINSFDFDNKCITWTTDGIHAGTVFLRNGRFSMTTHCGVLILKNDTENISLDFVYSFLKENLKQYARGEQNKRITVNIIREIKVLFPVDKVGDFDLEMQEEIAEKYKKIENIKLAINLELDKISEIEIDL